MKRPMLPLRYSCSMHYLTTALIVGSLLALRSAPVLDLSPSPLSGKGLLGITNTFTNGAVTVERTPDLAASWAAIKNVFTTSTTAQTTIEMADEAAFFRVLARDFSGGRVGFTNLTRAYGRLTTIAGAGGLQDVNNWRPEFEGGPATSALLSGPHMAMANRAGEVYIADKDAHGIRKVRLDGTIITVAGTNIRDNGTDNEELGTLVALNEPNGLWVASDGTVFILDLGNGKVRRLDTNGILRTHFVVPGGISIGRGLWVSEDETVAYVSSGSVVKKWTLSEGVTNLASGFTQLGNLVVDPWGHVVVTDRSLHRVFRIDSNGVPNVIAGNGGTAGGGDGQLAVATALNEVRGVWFLPNGGYFLVTHRGSQVWHVDVDGFIHLFLNGNRNGAHTGDGTWFYNPNEARVSECRAITMDYDGNVLITENDIGYVRKVEFLPFAP